MKLQREQLYPVIKEMAKHTRGFEHARSKDPASIAFLRERDDLCLEARCPHDIFLHHKIPIHAPGPQGFPFYFRLSGRELARTLAPMSAQSPGELVEFVFAGTATDSVAGNVLYRLDQGTCLSLESLSTFKPARMSYLSIGSPSPAETRTIHIKTSFLDDLAWILSAASHDTSRPQLNTVHFDSTSVVTTDGHRMHRQSSFAAFPLNQPSLTVGAPLLRQLMAMAPLVRAQDSFELHHTPRYEKIVFGPWTLYGPSTQQGIFPRYEQVIPTEGLITVLGLDTKDLRCAINMLPPTSGAIQGGIAFAIRADRAYIQDYLQRSTIWLRNALVRHALSRKFAFDGRFLLAAAGDCASIEFKIDPVNELAAARIDYGNRTAIVMPMRI